MTARTKLRVIGNSKGIIIPKSILDSVKLGEDTQFEVSISGNNVVLKPEMDLKATFANFLLSDHFKGSQIECFDESAEEIKNEVWGY